jgi:hypothetical protein
MGGIVFRWLAPMAGLALVATALADIFLTVLYARIGVAFITDWLGAQTWNLFKVVAPLVPRFRNGILSFCGPTVLVVAVTLWACMLVCGFGLIVWPRLGASVVSGEPSTPTPTDFATALYYSGNCLTTAFNGDLVPRTAFFRLLSAAESAIGISVLTLTLTYFLEIYNALLRRSTLAQSLHHATGGTGDAAEWVAGLGPGGDFSGARGELADIADEVMNFYESQHFYPILIYFRFGDPEYAVARKALVIFDTVTLIRTALDAERYAGFVHSAPVTQLWGGAMRAMQMMAKTFLGQPAEGDVDVDEATADRWRRRFGAAAERLRAAGIETARDEDAAAERYVALRRQWQGYVDGFIRFMQRTKQEVEPSGPEWA